MRYKLILQSIDREIWYNESEWLVKRPSVIQAERIFKGQIKPGMEITLDIYKWQEKENIPDELDDRITLKEYL